MWYQQYQIVVIILPPDSVEYDIVTDSSGKGLADVTVEVTGADGTVFSTTTDSDGNYEVEVLDGDYTVSVISTSGNYEGSVTTGGSDQSLDISLGGEAGSGNLSGTVTVADPNVVNGIMGVVAVLDSNGKSVSVAILYEDGKYEFGGITAGTYTIQAGEHGEPGDINGDNDVDLADVIMGLKVIAGVVVKIYLNKACTGKIGLAEVICIFGKI